MPSWDVRILQGLNSFAGHSHALDVAEHGSGIDRHKAGRGFPPGESSSWSDS